MIKSAASSPPLALSAVFGVLALGWGLMTLSDAWLETPSILLGLEALTMLGFVGAAFLRGEVEDKAGLCAGLVLALFAWALAAEKVAYLPHVASARDFGAGPALMWVYILLPVFLGGFALAGARQPLTHRALFLLGVWITGNGKLFYGSLVPGFALLLGALLYVALILSRGDSPGGLWRRWRGAFGLPLATVFLVLPLWWLLAGLLGDGQGAGLRVGLRLLIPTLVAVAMVRGLDPRGESYLFGGFIFGLSLAVLLAWVGAFEALDIYSWPVVFGSRLRVVGLHPNLGGSLLAMGLPLVLAWALAARGASSARRGFGVLLALCVLGALLWTGSRASFLGAAIGVIGLVVFLRTKRPFARVLPVTAACLVLALLVFSTSLGDPLRELLDAKALTQSALGQRWHIWKMAWSATQASPLTGVGPLSFHAHAAFAEPSYYDGTSQTLHTHNIFLSASAGAGLVGLALFAAYLFGMFEAGRRALFAKAAFGSEDRVLPAGLLGALVVLAICNQLDLGQSQVSFLPMFFMVALGVFGARLAGRQPGAQSPSTARGTNALAALLLWPAMGSTLFGVGLLSSAERQADAGEVQSAIATLELALGPLSHVRRSNVERSISLLQVREEDEAGRIETWIKATEARPRLSDGWVSLAEAQISAKRWSDAESSILRALELDPRGVSAPGMWMIAAQCALEMGDGKVARTRLEAAVAGGQGPRAGMRLRRDDSGALSFGLKGREEAIPLASIIDSVGAHMIELAEVDPVTSRRLMMGIVTGYRANNDLESALTWARRSQKSLLEPQRANFMVVFNLLQELGRKEEAQAAWRASPWADEPNLLSLYGNKNAQSKTTDITLDLFFTAGILREHHMASARSFLRLGMVHSARRELNAALYNGSVDFQRFEDHLVYLADLQEFGGSGEVLVEELERFWCSLGRRKGARQDARYLTPIAELLDAEFEGDMGEIEAAIRELTAGQGEALMALVSEQR